MKYIVVLGDGMADRKLENLGNKTPLESARTPNLDALAARSEIGMCKTVPDGMKPGSDVANLSVLGYDPKQGYTGRSPLEAVSIGIPLRSTDVTMRCNLVTVSDEENYEDKRMIDYSAGEISTREAKELIEYLKNHYKGILADRYQVDESEDKVKILEQVAMNRNCKMKGNELDYEKASKILLEEFRNGKLGKISLEVPEEIKEA